MASYVDNKILTKELGIWAKKVRGQIANGEKPDKMTDYIGECVYLISKNLSFKASFINYTFKEDMIGDAIENCIRYLKNFDVEKNANAFGYVSTIAHWAFVRRIKKENKRHVDHLYYVRESFSNDDTRDALQADNPNDVNGYLPYINHMLSILDDMNVELPDRVKADRKPRKVKKTVLDNIMTGDY